MCLNIMFTNSFNKFYFLFLTFLCIKIIAPMRPSTETLEVAIDHFKPEIGTFKLHYIINREHWDKELGAIFFYAGGETDFYYPDLMEELARDFKGLSIYCQHRYYDQSMPFGDNSLKGPEYYQYLTSRQAIEDFVDLIFFIKTGKKRTADNMAKKVFETGRNPVFVVGGYYSGQLAAWMRKIYPNIFEGALASSAPIRVSATSDCSAVPRFVTRIFKNAIPGKNCADLIRKSWLIWDSALSTETGRNWINKEFNLCTEVKNADDAYVFKCYLSAMYESMSKYNSVYPGYVGPNPVKIFCDKIQYSKSWKAFLKSIKSGLDLTVNYHKQMHCYHWNTNITDESYNPRDSNEKANPIPDESYNLRDSNEKAHPIPDASYNSRSQTEEAHPVPELLVSHGWQLQGCYEFPEPLCEDGIRDLFPKPETPRPNDPVERAKVQSDQCYKWYGIRTKDPHEEYGLITKNTASNIIFSNGSRDPWSAGSILKSLSPSLIAISIPEACHCDDIIANSQEPDSVKEARIRYREIFRNWTYGFYKRHGFKEIKKMYPINIPILSSKPNVMKKNPKLSKFESNKKKVPPSLKQF